MRTAIRVSQSFVRSHRIPAQVGVPSKRGAARKAAPSIGTSAFLMQKIDDIRPSETDYANEYGIDLEKSYTHVFKCCKMFSLYSGLKFSFSPKENSTKSQRLSSLVDYFEELISPLGLEFFVSKKTYQGEPTDILECAVYRSGRELEDTIVIMYVAPAVYLSPKSAELFKRFMKFFSDSTNIGLGIARNSENFYLDMIINMYEEDPYYEGNEDDEDMLVRKSVAEAYNENGEFWKVFEEIVSLPKQDAEILSNDIDKYRKECPNEEIGLIEAMIEGIPIVKDMNYYWYEFNPYDDGLPDEYGRDSCDGFGSSVFSSAILYSEQDGVGDMLLDMINGEVGSGIMMSGWNIHQYLCEETKKEDILEFIRCKDNVAEFDKWMGKYYTEMKKFDMYG